MYSKLALGNTIIYLLNIASTAKHSNFSIIVYLIMIFTMNPKQQHFKLKNSFNRYLSSSGAFLAFKLSFLLSEAFNLSRAII